MQIPIGEQDRVAGAILGCVLAADLAHPGGRDAEFAEWLCQHGLSERHAAPASPRFAVADLTAIATELLFARDDVTLFSGCVVMPDDLPTGPSWRERIPKVVADAISEWPDSDVVELPDAGALVGIPAHDIVALAARAGAAGVPLDWWMSGSLADPTMRGGLIEVACTPSHEASMVGGAATTFLERARASRSLVPPVEHSAGGVWFGNPLHLLDVPAGVTAVLSLGFVPRGMGGAGVTIELPLLWLRDGFDGSLSGGRCDDRWRAWRHVDSVDARHLSPPVELHGLGARERRAVATVASMVHYLRAAEHEVLVLGDWSGNWIDAISEELADGVPADFPNDGARALDAYRWTAREAWTGDARAAGAQRAERVASEQWSAWGALLGLALGVATQPDTRKATKSLAHLVGVLEEALAGGGLGPRPSGSPTGPTPTRAPGAVLDVVVASVCGLALAHLGHEGAAARVAEVAADGDADLRAQAGEVSAELVRVMRGMVPSSCPALDAARATPLASFSRTYSISSEAVRIAHSTHDPSDPSSRSGAVMAAVLGAFQGPGVFDAPLWLEASRLAPRLWARAVRAAFELATPGILGDAISAEAALGGSIPHRADADTLVGTAALLDGIAARATAIVSLTPVADELLSSGRVVIELPALFEQVNIALAEERDDETDELETAALRKSWDPDLRTTWAAQVVEALRDAGHVVALVGGFESWTLRDVWVEYDRILDPEGVEQMGTDGAPMDDYRARERFAAFDDSVGRLYSLADRSL